MQAAQHSLQELLHKFPSHPRNRSALDQLVSQTLFDTQPKVSSENWKTCWEYVLREEVFRFAVRIYFGPRDHCRAQC